MSLTRAASGAGGPVETTLWGAADGPWTAVSTNGAQPTALPLAEDVRNFSRLAIHGRSVATDLVVLYIDPADIPTCRPGDDVQTVGRGVSASGSAPGDTRSVPMACSGDGRTLHLARGTNAPLHHVNQVVGRRP